MKMRNFIFPVSGIFRSHGGCKQSFSTAIKEGGDLRFFSLNLHREMKSYRDTCSQLDMGNGYPYKQYIENKP